MSLLSSLYNIIFLGRIKDRPGPFRAEEVKKILVVRTDNIGDVICSTPAMASLRRQFPEARLSALVCTHSMDALYQNPVLDELYVYPKAKHRYQGYGKLKSWWVLWQTVRRIRKQKYDLAISLRSEFSSSLAWLVYASKARWKVGPEARGKRRKLGFFYNTPLSWPEKAGHEVEYALALLGKLGLSCAPEDICLGRPADAVEAGRKFIDENFAGAQPLVVNVGYWHYDQPRNWHAENYRQLLRRLKQLNLPLAITHGPGMDAWVQENILAQLQYQVPVFFSGHLLGLAALLEQCALFVTVDGGMVHVAAGAGVAVLDLVEAQHADRWYPWRVEQKTLCWQENVNNISVRQVLDSLKEMPAFQALLNNREC